MKPCPFCGEQIQDAAVKCRFCFEWLDPSQRPAWSEAGPPDVRAREPGDASSPPAGRWQPTPQVERWNSPGTIIMGSDVTSEAVGLPEDAAEPRDRTTPGTPLSQLTGGPRAPTGESSSQHFDRLRRSAQAVNERMPAGGATVLPEPSPMVADAGSTAPTEPTAEPQRSTTRPGDLRAGPQVVRIPTPMSSPTNWRAEPEPDPDEPQTMRGWRTPPDAEDEAGFDNPTHRPRGDQPAAPASTPADAGDGPRHDTADDAEPPPAASPQYGSLHEQEQVETVAAPERPPVDAFEAAFFGDDDDELDDDAGVSQAELGALVAPRKPTHWAVPMGLGAALILAASVFYGDVLFGDGAPAEGDEDEAEADAGETSVIPEPKVVEPPPVVEPVPPPPPPPPAADKLSDEDIAKLAEARDHYKRHRLSETREILDALLAKYARASEVLVLLAQVQLEQGDAKAALHTASSCVEVDADAADCWLTVAVLEQDSGGEARAIAAWEKYLVLAPDGAYAKDAARELKRLRAKVGK